MSNVKKKVYPQAGTGNDRAGAGLVLGSGAGIEQNRSRSVFHAKLPLQLDKEHDDCLTAMNDYIHQLQQLCGAGTHVAAAFNTLLGDTALSEISTQLKSIMVKMESLCATSGKQATEDIDKMWSLLNRAEDGKTSKSSDANIELAAQGLMCFLQMQCQFFQAATESVKQLAGTPGQHHQSKPAIIQSGTKTGTKNSRKEISLRSPAGLRQHLSSLFFEPASKSNSTAADGPAQSFFYVELGAEADGVPSAGQRGTSESLASAVSGMTLQPGSEAAHPESQNAYANAYPSNGQIATQEELDSVIDFLSRGPRQPMGMAAIPENQLPVMSRAVGSHLAGPQLIYQPQPRIVGLMGYPPPPQPQAQPQFQHRMSDGLLADSIPRDTRTNTWPIKPSQRHTFGQEMAQMMQMCGGIENLPAASEADYNQYLYPAKPKQPDLLPGNNVWSPAGETGFQRMWQYSRAPSDRPEPTARQWSITADSSSCSDESSSNGEMPWMMGLDLVSAVNKASGPQHPIGHIGAPPRRRHSSAEENLIPELVAPPLEKKSSTLDSKSAKAWSAQQQIWATNPSPDCGAMQDAESLRSGEAEKPGLGPAVHRPLTPQWSDPLLNKSLSVWDPGLSGGASQPSLTALPSDSAALTVTPRPVPPPRQRQQDRKY